MPTQTLEPSEEQNELDQMLVRMLLVAELLLNPTPQATEPYPQSDKNSAESPPESAAAEADV